MESLDSNFIETENAGLDSVAKGYILSTAKWGRFLSIMGFIFIGLMVIGAFSIGAIMSSLGGLGGPMAGGLGAFGGAMLTFVYLVLAALMFFPTYYLFKFSTKAISALTNGSGSLTEALGNLKSVFKFYGIFTIIILSFYVLAILIGIIAAVAS